ncbi:MAG: hypothetical protein M3R12_01410 [Actinomycetota bacterium]|nr:hypothetical protein [Actinomycetota bacterium]
MREPAPPYANEGPHALWHVSEDDSIRRFEPHVAATAAEREPLVWAVDTRHVPLYWFPRDCPRACFWSNTRTTRGDSALLNGSPRVHAIEADWLPRMRETRVVAYRLPEASFEHGGDGFWTSRETVEPLEVVELGDLLARHAAGLIELRVVPRIWPLWTQVAASTLEFSGIRLRNARPPAK